MRRVASRPAVEKFRHVQRRSESGSPVLFCSDMRASISFFGVFLSFLCDPGHGERDAFNCANKNVCDPYCYFCVDNFFRPQDCYEILVLHFCLSNFNISMDAMNSTEWCSLEKVKSAYNNFTVCTESIADCFLLPWPNHFVEDMFVGIHTKYFQECPTEALRDPPPNIVLALVMTPICLIPIMVVLVVLKTKNGDMRS